MCGIAGVIDKNVLNVTATRLQKMTDVIAHRGPDGKDHWISENGMVGLGHRRLSIIDLSHEADQPMHYLDRYTLIFNGEIYNYLELKEELLLKGYVFKTCSDTEVLMALYDKEREQCLQKLDGMFAFTLYDKQENTVFIVRDRFGEKPFFYSYKEGEYFLFGSEMKCLWEAGITKEVNNRMMFNYLSFGYIENPNDLSETFFNNCTRLPHSHYAMLNVHTLKLEIKKYYDINWHHINNDITLKQAKEEFQSLLYTSVKRRLRSDVAVGSSLSGGLDSSLLVCVIDDLKKEGGQKQNTFSAVFPGFERDERKFMDYVIAKTNVDPHFVTPKDDELLRDLEKLSWHQEEPYVSASIYVQYRVMELAKKHDTTVLLDGQGADEILAGYHHYYVSYFNEIQSISKSLRKSQMEAYVELHGNNRINGLTGKSLGDRVRDISPSLVKPIKGLKLSYNQRTNPLFSSDFFQTYKKDLFETPGSNFSTLNEALYSSTMKHGLQQLLRYADRNSMAHSREVRLPFLYHELVEFLFSLPSVYKINKGWTKWIMRETFDILPKEIQWRRDKIGYEPPQKSWMRHAFVQKQVTNNLNRLKEHHILHNKVNTGNPEYYAKLTDDMRWRMLNV